MNKHLVKYNVTLIIASMSACIYSAGIADEIGQSVMFRDNPGNQSETTITTTNTQIDSVKTNNDCENQIKKIEQLKGKPQRRHAAIQRFKQECSSERSND